MPEPIREISERQSVDRSPEHSEEQFRTLAESIPQLAWFADANGFINWYNRRWYEYTGTTPEQMQGWGWQSVHDPAVLPHVLQRWEQSLASGEPFEMIFPLRGADGVYRPFLTRVVPLRKPGGEIVRWVGTNTELSEQLAIEQRLRDSEERERAARRVAEEAADSVRRLQSVTEAALAHLELKELLRELVHRLRGLLSADTIAILLTSDDGDTLVVRAAEGLPQDVLEAVTIHEGEGFAGTIAATRKPLVLDDTSTFPIVSPTLRNSGVRSLAGAPLLAGQRLTGVVHVGSYAPRHFTEDEVQLLQMAADRVALAIEHARLFDSEVRARRELESRTAEVQRLNQELELRVEERTSELLVAVRELEAFSYSVSHDLRAPLRSIDGFSQILLEDYLDKLDGEGRDYLQRIRNATRHMGQLIDDLLQLSRVSRGELRSERVDLSAAAARIVADLRHQDPERAVEVEIEPGLVTRGDPRLLDVALRNLLGNAWKFTSRRSAAHIRFGRTLRDGDAVFYVQDNGAGFNMEYAGKLFHPFQRLHAPREFEGTGIGLATVQRIITRHRGRVWAEGKPGSGATFYFKVAA